MSRCFYNNNRIICLSSSSSYLIIIMIVINIIIFINHCNCFEQHQQQISTNNLLIKRSHSSLWNQNHWKNHQKINDDNNYEIIKEIQKKPIIQEQEQEQQQQWPNTMKNITVTVGRDATFECVFPKLKDFRLVWFHKTNHHVLLAMHDTIISKNGRISVRSHANTTFYLTIHDVQEMDRGYYLCQVNTKPMRIQIGYLEVNVPPSFIEEKTSSDFDINENSSTTLSCLAKGRPEPLISWRREDEQPIQLDSTTNESSLIIKGQYLNLKNVSRHQMGAYLCIASNGILPTISKRIFLGVNFVPIIWTNKRLIETPLSTNVTLECFIESYPKANVYWQKNERLPLIVYSDKKYQLSILNENFIPYRFVAKLKIFNLNKNDIDKYQCYAKNKIGNDQNFIKLIQSKNIFTTTTTTTTTANYNNYKLISTTTLSSLLINRKKQLTKNLFNNKNNKQWIRRKYYNKKKILESNTKILKNVDTNANIHHYTDDNNDDYQDFYDNNNDDDDDEEMILEYETNYMAPELIPGINNKINSSLSLISYLEKLIIILCSLLCYILL